MNAEKQKVKSKMSQLKTPLIVGAIGGIMPPLFPLAMKCLSTNVAMPNYSFALGCIFLAFLGGLTVFLFEEENPRKAFFLGISAPSTLQALLVQSTKQSVATLSLFSSAYAQTPTQTPTIQPEKTLKFEFSQPIPGAFLVSKKDGITKQIQQIDKKSFSIPMSDLYGTLFIEGQSVNAIELKISDCHPNCVIDVSENSWSGFLEALGANAPRYNVNLNKGK